MGKAYRCERCDGIPEFRLERFGDAAVTWACMDDVAVMLVELRRDFERTQVLVTQAVTPRQVGKAEQIRVYATGGIVK